MNAGDYFVFALWCLLFLLLLLLIVQLVVGIPHPVKLRSCACGAHWWIRVWGFWRHLDASPFNDKLQDQWTIWMFEFRDVLVLSVKEQRAMGYPIGPLWEDGRPMWARSKWQLSISPGSYCVRCALHGS